MDIYTYPHCGQTHKAAAGLRLDCGDCLAERAQIVPLLIQVKDALVGDFIEVYQKAREGQTPAYVRTGRFYKAAAHCPLIGARTCWSSEGVKVKVAPTTMCRAIGN
jgi:hypothetical protein